MVDAVFNKHYVLPSTFVGLLVGRLLREAVTRFMSWRLTVERGDKNILSQLLLISLLQPLMKICKRHVKVKAQGGSPFKFLPPFPIVESDSIINVPSWHEGGKEKGLQPL